MTALRTPDEILDEAAPQIKVAGDDFDAAYLPYEDRLRSAVRDMVIVWGVDPKIMSDIVAEWASADLDDLLEIVRAEIPNDLTMAQRNVEPTG